MAAEPELYYDISLPNYYFLDGIHSFIMQRTPVRGSNKILNVH